MQKSMTDVGCFITVIVFVIFLTQNLAITGIKSKVISRCVSQDGLNFTKYPNNESSVTKLTWFEAKSYCTANHSYLMDTVLPCKQFTTFDDDDIWVNIKKSYHFYQKFGPKPIVFTPPKGVMVSNWWTPGHPIDECVGINMKERYLGYLLTAHCDEKLSFVCVDIPEKKTYEKVKDIEVNMIRDQMTSTSDQALNNITFLRCNATGVVGGVRQELSTELHGVRYAWTKDAVFVDMHTNIMLPSLVYLKTRPRQSYLVKKLWQQGTFICKVFPPLEIFSVSSPPVTVKSQDVVTLLATFTNMLPFEQTHNAFSTIGYQRYVEKGPLVSFVNKYLLNNSSQEQSPLIDGWDLSAIWVDRLNNTKLRLFIYHTPSAKSKDSWFDIVDRFTSYVTNKIRSVNGTENDVFDIKQTEYCEGLKGNSREWPRTRALQKTLSNPVCFSGNLELSQQSCRTDFTNGVSWTKPSHPECWSLNDFDIPSTCPNTYRSSDGRCIKYIGQPMNWKNAHLNCASDFASVSTKHIADKNSSVWINKRVGDIIFQSRWNKKNFLIVQRKFKSNSGCLYYKKYPGFPRMLPARCDMSFSFACSSPKYNASLITVKSKNRTFAVSILLKSIYEVISDEKLTWFEATKTCASKGGKLANLKKEVATPLYSFIMFQLKLVDGDLWISGLSDGGFFYLNVVNDRFDSRKQSNFDDSKIKLYHGSPDLKLGYICQFNLTTHPDRQLDPPYIELSEEKDFVFSNDIWGVKPKFKCRYNGIVPKSAIFYKDGLPLNYQGRDRFSFQQAPNALSRSIIAPYLQGYYWCEGTSLLSRKKVKSKKILFTVPGVWTYICKLTMKKPDSYKKWSLDSSDPVYYRILKYYDKHLSSNIATMNMVLKQSQMFSSLVTKIDPIDEGKVRMTFGIYVLLAVFSRKKRKIEANQDDRYIWKKFLKFMRSRAENPKAYNDSLSQWLQANQVPADSISVRLTDLCTFDETENPGSKRITLTWLDTPVGTSTRPLQLCTTSEGDPVIRRCLGNFTTGAYWSPVIGQCDGQPSNITSQLKTLSKSVGTVNNIASNLTNLTSVTRKLRTVDIGYIADVLDIINYKANVLEPPVLSDVISTLDHVLSLNQSSLSRSQNLLNTSMRLVNSLDIILEKVKLNDTTPQFRSVQSNLAVEVWNVKDDAKHPVRGIADLTSDSKNESITLLTLRNSSELLYNETDAAILLPNDFFHQEFSRPRVYGFITNLKVSFTVFKDGKFFRPSTHTDSDKPISNTAGKETSVSHTLNTAVISASIMGTVVKYLNPPLKLVFNPVKNYGEEEGLVKCVYWDMTANDRTGGWSTSGCYLERQTSGRLVCVCDHLTNFAVIVDLYGQNNKIPIIHERILDIITYIGCAISICGLVLTILTFMLFKKWRNSLTNQIHVNLAGALLMSILIFVLGLDKTWHFVDHTCLVVSILLHYFLLCSFMWMLVEAVKHYLFFVAYMKSYVPNFMKKSMVIAWGIPAIVVIVTVSIDHTLYDGGQYFCWMALRGFYYSFLLPMGVIICTNIVLFVRIIYSLAFDRQRKKVKLRTNQPDKKDIRIRFYAALGIFILSGATWALAFFAVSDARLPFQYLFCLFNSLQGFFIFFLMVFKERSARSFWNSVIQSCCKLKKDDGFSGQYSSSGIPNRIGYSNENKTGVTSQMANSASSSSSNEAVKYSKRVNAVKVIPA